jgi:hypothetical protein
MAGRRPSRPIALRTGSEPLMTLARAQRGLELIDAAYRAVPSRSAALPW